MKSFPLFTAIHFNTEYSSLPKSYLLNLISHCYSPIIHTINKHPSLRLGIEMTAKTLETIQTFDPMLIHTIREFVVTKRIEIIASGYEQVIAPLSPYSINSINIKKGNQVYKKILGFIPAICYVNEQVFADSLPKLYKSHGYKAFIMDSDSLPDSIISDSRLYKKIPRIGHDTNGSLPVIWNSSILFQKMHKFINSAITEKEYLSHLQKQTLERLYLCIYGGDAEVFGFKPYGLESKFQPEIYRNTYLRFSMLLHKLATYRHYKFVLPSNLLDKYPISHNCRQLTTSSYPILCKKQEKYNITRWALAGRNNSIINTFAHRQTTSLPKLWASDYRTFAGEEKYYNFFTNLKPPLLFDTPRKYTLSKTRKHLFSTTFVRLKLNPKMGGTIDLLTFPKVSKKALIGTIPHGFYPEMHLNPDWFTNHTVIVTNQNEKLTDLNEATLYTEDTKEELVIYSKSYIGKHEVWKRIGLSKTENKVRLRYYYFFHDLEPLSIRGPIFTHLPEGWDRETLVYQSHYGTKDLLSHNLSNSTINQEASISPNVSSKSCLGMTENQLIVKDKNKQISFSIDTGQLQIKPLLHFETSKNGYFYFRIYFSMAESDETSHHFFRGYLSHSLTLKASPSYQ